MKDKVIRIGVAICWGIAGVASVLRGNIMFLVLAVVMCGLFLYRAIKD